MKKLKCSNTECESHDSNPLFDITVGVDEGRCLAENLNKIEAKDFVCLHCGSEAARAD